MLGGFLLCFLFIFNSGTEHDNDPTVNEALVEEINSKARFWRASLKSAKLLNKLEDFEARLGAQLREVAVGGNEDLQWRPDDIEEYIELPRSFDSRKKWPECPSISKIVDQGPCGGCWATAATSVAQDRYCIQNVGQENPHLSYGDVLTCSDAGTCHGGSTYSAYEYIKNKGVPTGSMRDTDNWEETCSPSPFELCNHHQAGTHGICPDSHTLPPPKCIPSCKETSSQDYHKDRYYADKVWGLYGTEEIMREIYHRGPVSIAFRVFKDFYFYLDGIYEHVAGESIGLHAVRLIGWGFDEKSGLDYWIIANSWDPDWGEDGFMRIKKESDYLGIGNLGSEACSMELSAELQANVQERLEMKSKMNALLDEEKARSIEKENQVGFLTWSVIAPRNIRFALWTLGIFGVGFLIMSIYAQLQKYCLKKQLKQAQNYDAIPVDGV